MEQSKRREILLATVNEMKKSAEGVVGMYQDIGKDIDIETIGTGSIAVDHCLGGGFPKGKIINLVGHTGSGKTTLALTACAKLQAEFKARGDVANIMYIDAEQALDPNYAEALGVNVNDLIISQPANGEEGFSQAEMFINSGVGDLLIIDSVAAMIPKTMLDRDYDKEPQPGAFAKFISQVIARIAHAAGKRNTTVILVNQWKPVMKVNQYVAVAGAIGGYIQPGGGTLPFYCSQIIEIKRKGTVKEGDVTVSAITQISVKKNRIAPPYRLAEFYITYGKGVDKTQEIIGLGTTLGVIVNKGSYYSIPGIEEYTIGERTGKTVQGRQNFSKWLDDHEEVKNELEIKIRESIVDARTIRVEQTPDQEDEEEVSTKVFSPEIVE